MRTLEEQLVDASLDMGKALLLAGGEVTRVEDTITRILHAYGMHKVGVFTITSLIEVTARTPDGDEIVKARRIAGGYATNLDRVEQLNALSREICATCPPPQDITASVEAIKYPKPEAAWISYIGAMLPPVRFTTDVPITTAQDMYDAVTSRFEEMDVLVMAAAVADYRPVTVASDKIKKKDGDLSIPVERTADILGTIGPKKTHQFLCGFSMETRDLVENSSAKLTKKNLDMVVANNLKVAGAGFGVDTNVVTLITPDGTRELPLMSKADVADAILDEILKRRFQ